MMFDMVGDPVQQLPQPNDPFEWVQAALPRRPVEASRGAPAALVCRALLPYADHLFTTRNWTLGERTSERGDAAWGDVAEALQVAAGRLVRINQVHGARAVVADPDQPRPSDADIVVTDRRDIAVAVQAADCVPLLLADRRTGAVAAAHAGWRGLAAGVPAAAVGALVSQYGSRPEDLVAAIGPSIGSCCYEVGPDVHEAFAQRFGAEKSSAWFQGGGRPDRWMFDTWQSTRTQLEAAGVPGAQIYEARLCTASHPEVFCSYRRDGAPAGRIAGAIRSGAARPRP